MEREERGFSMLCVYACTHARERAGVGRGMRKMHEREETRNERDV